MSLAGRSGMRLRIGIAMSQDRPVVESAVLTRPTVVSAVPSPDGRYVAFLCRTYEVGSNRPIESEVVVVEVTSGAVALPVETIEPSETPSWLPDGDGLLMVGRDNESGWPTLRVRLIDGEPFDVPLPEAECMSPVVGAGGRCEAPQV